MDDTDSLFYKYSKFSYNTLDSLCRDTLYFSNPNLFNDPFDSKPNLKSDSSNRELKKLLEFLIKSRVEKEIVNSLKQAKISEESATHHALSYANQQSVSEIQSIEYNSTDPDYDISTTKAESWLLLLAIERELLKHYEHGVCCFSISDLNPLLWSHYADQHNGICVGYSAERKPKPIFHKVDYDNLRLIKTSLLINAFIENQELEKQKLEHDVLLKKAECWMYEDEIRLIATQGIQNSPLLLKEVTFGLRCSSSIKHTVINALSGRKSKVDFYEIYAVRGSYELKRELLDIAELSMYLPHTATSPVEVFGDVRGKNFD